MGGADLFRYDETSHAWVGLGAGDDAIPEPQEVFWVDGRLLVRGDLHTPGASGPGPLPEATAWYDPTTGTATRLGSKDTGLGLGEVHAMTSWTGAALWAWNPVGSMTGPGVHVVPGDAIASDT